MVLIYEKESYEIIGVCLEVYNELGKGFSEIVYKDAIEYEFQLRNMPYNREKTFKIKYKDKISPHSYDADFIVFNKIALEVKTIEQLVRGNVRQTLNYLAASELKLGLLVNFGEDSLKHKRIIL